MSGRINKGPHLRGSAFRASTVHCGVQPSKQHRLHTPPNVALAIQNPVWSSLVQVLLGAGTRLPKREKGSLKETKRAKFEFLASISNSPASSPARASREMFG